jgi:hypothetical protein
LAGCKIDREKSEEFKKLLKQWKRDYPHIESDVEKALAEIKGNIQACRGRLVLGGPRFDAYKYRQKSSDIPHGSSFGLRIIGLHDRKTGVMYPIIVYPKPVWATADNATIYAAMKEVKRMLGHCTSPDCDGKLVPTVPKQTRVDNDIPQRKLRCEKCNTVEWLEQIVEA